MSVTSAQGFRAAGVAAGFKSGDRLDLALVVNDGPSDAAASVFTSNRAKANPVLWSQQAIADGRARAVVLNSGGANCFTGAQGFQATHRTAELVAEQLGVSAQDVIVCSTGLIGEQLPAEAIERGVPLAAAALGDHGIEAAQAIMTTDTVQKTAVRSADGWTIGGMAKGAGMLAPGLATMLVVVTTDAVVEQPLLDRVLREACRITFDRLDSDGCMSTNDTVTLLTSGASGVVADAATLQQLLIELCDDLASQLQADAEGASHNISIEVVGARSESDALEAARAIARNNLFKAAMFGNDPNWGRVLSAIGTTTAHFDPYEVDVSFNGVRLCHAGAPDRPREEVDLTPRATHVLVNLNAGEATVTLRTNDLTHDYVHENSAYAS